MNKSHRPLSPHIQIYRPQLTSVLSVFHRATGMVLSAASLALTLWLATLSAGQQWFDAYCDYLSTPLGIIFLMGVSFSFFYHMFNGLRHLAWDSGHGFDLVSVYRSGYLVLALTSITTLSVWILIFKFKF